MKEVFIGFQDGLNMIRYYRHRTKKILVSRNFKFPDGSGKLIEFVFNDTLQLEGELAGSKESEQQSPDEKPSTKGKAKDAGADTKQVFHWPEVAPKAPSPELLQEEPTEPELPCF
ncbi:hypothetical protein FRB99_000463 [Tulasnella sp. 403]|nr:hypothetical protein FRB99_000463 [Tulasnella sp. 403]